MHTNFLISPHPDDIALSISCFVSQQPGKRVIINTHNLSKSDDFLRDVTANRIAEETEFADAFGASVLFLNHPDTNSLGRSWGKFDFSIRIINIHTIAAALSLHTSESKGSFDIYVPLGVGFHPDHVECYYSVMHFLLTSKQAHGIFFYQEIPYKLNGPKLSSHIIIEESGKQIRYPYDIHHKRSFLQHYPSQFSPGYIEQILMSNAMEELICINCHNSKFKQLCSIDFLAQRDGITLL